MSIKDVLCYLLHFHKVTPRKLIYFMIEIGGWGITTAYEIFVLLFLGRHAVSVFKVTECGLGDC